MIGFHIETFYSCMFSVIQENCLNHVDEWIPFLGMFNSGVKILVCEQCSVENSSKPIPKINGM